MVGSLSILVELGGKWTSFVSSWNSQMLNKDGKNYLNVKVSNNLFCFFLFKGGVISYQAPARWVTFDSLPLSQL